MKKEESVNKKNIKQKTNKRNLIKMSLKGIWPYLIAIYSLSVVIIYLNMLLTKYFGYTIDGILLKNNQVLPEYLKNIFAFTENSILKSGSENYLLRLYVIILIMCVVTNIDITISHLKGRLCTKFNLNLDRRLKKILMTHLIKLDFKAYNNYSKAEIIQRINSDVNVYASFFYEKLGLIVDTILTLVFAIGYTLNMNIYLGAYVIISVIMLLIMFFWYYKRTRNEIEKMMKYNVGLIDSTNNIIENQEMIRVFNRNEIEQYTYDKTNLKFVKEINKFNWHKVFFEMFSNLIKTLRQPVMYFIGGFLYIKGEIGIGELTVAISFAEMVFNCFFNANISLQNINEIVLSYRKVQDFLNKDEEKIDNRKNVELSGDIVFKDVTIYIDETDILKNINLTIKQGESLAIFGDNGVGKTIFAKTLLGFYDYKGDIFIGKDNMKDVNYSSVRKYVSLVLQDLYLLNDTIRNNILINNPDAKDSQIKEVLKIVNFDREVEGFVNKLDTRLGDGNLSLSGGQSQRLSIARELISSSKFVILDDSLCKLDKNTREKLVENIESIKDQKTCIFITHDVDVVEKIKNILFFNNGEVICGKHEDLLKTNSEYKRMIDVRKKSYIEQ